MIDGLFKRHIDPLWESMATPLVRMGMTPNQVTATGLVLICLTSALYLWHGNPAVFGLTLAFAFAFAPSHLLRLRVFPTFTSSLLHAYTPLRLHAFAPTIRLTSVIVIHSR